MWKKLKGRLEACLKHVVPKAFSKLNSYPSVERDVPYVQGNGQHPSKWQSKNASWDDFFFFSFWAGTDKNKLFSLRRVFIEKGVRTKLQPGLIAKFGFSIPDIRLYLSLPSALFGLMIWDFQVFHLIVAHWWSHALISEHLPYLVFVFIFYLASMALKCPLVSMLSHVWNSF